MTIKNVATATAKTAKTANTAKTAKMEGIITVPIGYIDDGGKQRIATLADYQANDWDLARREINRIVGAINRAEAAIRDLSRYNRDSLDKPHAELTILADDFARAAKAFFSGGKFLKAIDSKKVESYRDCMLWGIASYFGRGYDHASWAKELIMPIVYQAAAARIIECEKAHKEPRAVWTDSYGLKWRLAPASAGSVSIFLLKIDSYAYNQLFAIDGAKSVQFFAPAAEVKAATGIETKPILEKLREKWAAVFLKTEAENEAEAEAEAENEAEAEAEAENEAENEAE